MQYFFAKAMHEHMHIVVYMHMSITTCRADSGKKLTIKK